MPPSATARPFEQPRHVVVLGHPDPESFCGSVARTYCDTVTQLGHHAVLRDLYALDFNPLLGADERAGDAPCAPAADIAEDVEILRGADVIALVYPIWFGMPPAIIKGYVDRVLGAGFSPAAIRQENPHRPLEGKRLALFTSSASTQPWLEERGQWLALRQAFETYLEAIFALRDCGHTHFDAVVEEMSPHWIEERLAVVRERARAVSAAVLSEKRAAQMQRVRQADAS